MYDWRSIVYVKPCQSQFHNTDPYHRSADPTLPGMTPTVSPLALGWNCERQISQDSYYPDKFMSRYKFRHLQQYAIQRKKDSKGNVLTPNKGFLFIFLSQCSASTSLRFDVVPSPDLSPFVDG